MAFSKELSKEFKKEFVIRIGGKNGKEAVLYNGLLALAHHDSRFSHIEATIKQYPCAENKWTAFAEATIYDKSGKIIGREVADANAQNCGKMTGASFPRMAATRAKARAFRDFLNIGMVSADEIGDIFEPEYASVEQISKIKKLGKAAKLKKNKMYDTMFEITGAEEFSDLLEDDANKFISHLEGLAKDNLSDDETF